MNALVVEDTDWAARKAGLARRLASLERVLVAFSGGVDSSVLFHAAHAALGRGATAVIADSPSLPRRELALAREVAQAIGGRLVEIMTREGDDPAYRANLGDRCYFCKYALFDAMRAHARAEGYRWLAFGEIVDDRADDRPGARAAEELGVIAPLSELGFSKADVRRYAREAGLAVADKPASACLSSRIPVGTEVTPERLARVEAAEDALLALGLVQLRVRHLDTRARVEVGAGELAYARSMEPAIGVALSAAGYEHFELAAYLPPGARRER